MALNSFRTGPDETGHFGIFGGRFVAETLMPLILDLEKHYNAAKTDPAFKAELDNLLAHYAGRPSPLYYAERMTFHVRQKAAAAGWKGGAKIYFKREELNHTGAHKINNVLGQILLARRMGKTRIIAETGAGQHGVATATACALADYLVELIEGFRKNPTDAMFSKLVNDASGPDGPMSVADAATNGQLLLLAGHDFTVNTIAHTVLNVLRNPGSFDLLRRRPELIPATIEESLRLDSAVFFWPTWNALADIEIAGTVIPARSRVFFVYGAANRDPKKFPNPNKFDLERLDKEHLGWGGGIHVCFGGPLARLEVNLAVENFVRRVENPRLVEDPPEYRFSPLFRGPRHLLIDYDRIKD